MFGRSIKVVRLTAQVSLPTRLNLKLKKTEPKVQRKSQTLGVRRCLRQRGKPHALVVKTVMMSTMSVLRNKKDLRASSIDGANCGA